MIDIPLAQPRTAAGLLRKPFIFCLLVAVLFTAACMVGITGPGLFYDELHQACAAFLYLDDSLTGVPFAYQIGKIPFMNMGYSGAIKSFFYGMYLKGFKEFSVLSWRTLPCMLVASGLFAALMALMRKRSARAGVIFAALFLTDIDIFISTRFDWGPTALALAFRLVFIAVWVGGESLAASRSRGSFWLGLIFSLAVFEKLSSVVLLLPLTFIVLTRITATNWRQARAAVLGAAIGALPLIVANIHSYIIHNKLISVSDTFNAARWPLASFISGYIGLGSGSAFFLHLFDRTGPEWYVQGALYSNAVLLFACSVLAIMFWKYDVKARIAFVALAGYLTIAVWFYFFPQRTWAHHWLVGTPFQYLAVAMIASFVAESSFMIWRGAWIRKVLLILVVVCLGLRVAGSVELVYTAASLEYGMRWKPEFSELGLFARRNATEALFVATDWGVGSQIYCFTAAAPGTLAEVFGQNRSVLSDQLQQVLNGTTKKVLYVVRPARPIINNFEDNISFVEDAIAARSDWEQTGLPPDAPGGAVFIRKYVKKDTVAQ